MPYGHSKIDFLFPILVKQTLACRRAANSIINYYVFCTSLQSGQSMLTTIPQLHMQHFNIAQVNHRVRLRHAFTSVLKNPDFNSHVILRKRQFME